MSICTCPVASSGGIKSQQHIEFVNSFLQNLVHSENTDWSLLELKTLVERGNTLDSMQDIIPFRGGPCTRSAQCCANCTLTCLNRCVQDCLTRVYMWKQTVYNTPESRRDELPLYMRMAVCQQFDTLEEISVFVSDVINRRHNPALANYGDTDNPYKMSYAQVIELNEQGKKKYDPVTGEYKIIRYPESGLCPYCFPNSLVNGVVFRKQRN